MTAEQFRRMARSERDLERDYRDCAAGRPARPFSPAGAPTLSRADLVAAARGAADRACQWDQLADRAEATS